MVSTSIERWALSNEQWALFIIGCHLPFATCRLCWLLDWKKAFVESNGSVGAEIFKYVMWPFREKENEYLTAHTTWQHTHTHTHTLATYAIMKISWFKPFFLKCTHWLLHCYLLETVSSDYINIELIVGMLYGDKALVAVAMQFIDCLCVHMFPFRENGLARKSIAWNHLDHYGKKSKMCEKIFFAVEIKCEID